MLIGSLVELYVGLHSCLCFSHLEKLVLKASSTPPRYLLDTLLSVELLQLFLIAIPTAPRHLLDRSRLLLPPRQLLNTCWIDRDSSLVSANLFLDTSLIPVSVDDHFLDTFLNRHLDTSRHLHLSRFTPTLFKLLVRSGTHFARSLSRYFFDFSTKLSHLTPLTVPQGFFKLFQVFLHLVSF